MKEVYYLASSDLYYREGKPVSLSVEPCESNEHWWTEKTGVFDDQTFNCELSSYTNPHDLLPNTNIIQVASGRLISLFRKYSDSIEEFNTIWENAPENFKSKDYKVIRFPSLPGFIDLSRSVVEEFVRPSKPGTILKIVHSPNFVEGSPKVFRPAEGAGLYVSQCFREDFTKLRLNGMIFTPI